MRHDPVLKIRKGRHLLQELCVRQYISNDTMLAGGDHGDTSSMVGDVVQVDADGKMVVTGANGSGKSAYGKQVRRRRILN